MNFSENLKHIRQRNLIKFKIIPLRLLHSLILLVKNSKRKIFLNKIPQLTGINKVQIVSYIKNRTLKVKAFHKDMFGVFINLESRKDLRDVFKNILNQQNRNHLLNFLLAFELWESLYLGYS